MTIMILNSKLLSCFPTTMISYSYIASHCSHSTRSWNSWENIRQFFW